MIHLTIDAAQPGDLVEQLMGICKLICGVHVDAPAKVAAPVAEPVKQPEPVAAVKEEPVIEPAVAIPETTVRKALNEYRKAHGATATRELLAKFGADSFPALPTDKYAAVMEACNAAE